MVYYYSFKLKYLAVFNTIIVITIIAIIGANSDNNSKYDWNNGITWFVKLYLPRRNQKNILNGYILENKATKIRQNLMITVLSDLKGCENSVLWVKDVINT